MQDLRDQSHDQVESTTLLPSDTSFHNEQSTNGSTSAPASNSQKSDTSVSSSPSSELSSSDSDSDSLSFPGPIRLSSVSARRIQHKIIRSMVATASDWNGKIVFQCFTTDTNILQERNIIKYAGRINKSDGSSCNLYFDPEKYSIDGGFLVPDSKIL